MGSGQVGQAFLSCLFGSEQQAAAALAAGEGDTSAELENFLSCLFGSEL